MAEVESALERLNTMRSEEQSTIIVGELKVAREALDAHYRQFITYLNAVQEIQPEESISQAAQYYNEDIRKIELQIAQSRRKKKDEDSSEDGGSQDGSLVEELRRQFQHRHVRATVMRLDELGNVLS